VAAALVLPDLRFKRQHLTHHRNANLTARYDDPESNYLGPAIWARVSKWLRALFRVNNTPAEHFVWGLWLGVCVLRRGFSLLLFSMATIP
jgi:fatty acid desaturase